MRTQALFPASRKLRKEKQKQNPQNTEREETLLGGGRGIVKIFKS